MESKIKQLTKKYNQLEEISKQSFRYLKTKEMEKYQENHKKEMAGLAELVELKNQLQAILLQKEMLHKKELSEKIATLKEAEEKYRNQIALNIELATAMKEIYTEKVNLIIDVNKDKNDGNDSILLDQDY